MGTIRSIKHEGAGSILSLFKAETFTVSHPPMFTLWAVLFQGCQMETIKIQSGAYTITYSGP